MIELSELNSYQEASLFCSDLSEWQEGPQDSPVVTHIIDSMFSLLRLYFEQHDCTCISQLVLYQLKRSAQSIKEMAWEYHFADASFFCRYFKKHTGMTPQQVRE